MRDRNGGQTDLILLVLLTHSEGLQDKRERDGRSTRLLRKRSHHTCRFEAEFEFEVATTTAAARPPCFPPKKRNYGGSSQTPFRVTISDVDPLYSH